MSYYTLNVIDKGLVFSDLLDICSCSCKVVLTYITSLYVTFTTVVFFDHCTPIRYQIAL